MVLPSSAATVLHFNGVLRMYAYCSFGLSKCVTSCQGSASIIYRAK